MDEPRKNPWRKFWLAIPFVVLVLWIASIGLLAWMGAKGMLLTAAEKQAASATARENLAKEEALLVQLTRAHNGLVTKVHGEVLDEILSTKDEVSEVETQRRVEAAVNSSSEVAALRKLISEQTIRIARAREMVAETESKLPR